VSWGTEEYTARPACSTDAVDFKVTFRVRLCRMNSVVDELACNVDDDVLNVVLSLSVSLEPVLLGSLQQSPAAMCSSDGVASAIPRREKDKSSKRKSNLNRSLATEEVVCNDTALLGGE
jgi:hypothetical protein